MRNGRGNLKVGRRRKIIGKETLKSRATKTRGIRGKGRKKVRGKEKNRREDFRRTKGKGRE